MWLKQIQFRFYGLLCCPVVGSMLYGLIHVSFGTLLGGALWLGFPMSVWVETAAAQLVMPPLCFVSKTRETELRLIGDYLNMGCLFQCWVFFFHWDSPSWTIFWRTAQVVLQGFCCSLVVCQSLHEKWIVYITRLVNWKNVLTGRVLPVFPVPTSQLISSWGVERIIAECWEDGDFNYGITK